MSSFAEPHLEQSYGPDLFPLSCPHFCLEVLLSLYRKVINSGHVYTMLHD
jgi:hypothetical protein